jgi:hypothetical protein
MAPFSLSPAIADRAVGKRDQTAGHEGPARRLAGPERVGNVERKAPEDVADPVHVTQALDEPSFGGRSGQLPLKERERVRRAKERVDAESNGDERKRIGADAEGRVLRDGHFEVLFNGLVASVSVSIDVKIQCSAAPVQSRVILVPVPVQC